MSALTPGAMPFDVIMGLNGRPLNGGRVYIGEPNKDPEQYPQPVFWDAEGAVPAAQPLDTSGGYVVRAGTPARWWTTGPYSITVRDRQGRQVFHAPKAANPPSGSVGPDAITNDPDQQKAVIDKLGLGGAEGAGLVGYTRPGDNAVPRTLLDRGRDKTHVKDSGVEGSPVYGAGPDETAKLIAAFDDAKARNIGSLDFDGGVFIKTSSLLHFKGSFNDGRNFFVNGNGASIVRATRGDGLAIGDPLEPSHEYGMRWHIRGLNLTQEAEVKSGAGFLINEAANIRFYDAWLQGWRFGAYFQGGLLSSIYRTELRQCDWGYYGGVKGLFAPNQNLLFDCRFTHNKRAIYQSEFSYGVFTLLSCQVEGNNDGGTATDGVAVTDFQDAGHVNIAFSHMEGNPGQWSLRYNSPDRRGLLAIGSEMIQTGDTGVEITAGRFTGISSRMTSSASTKDINFAGPTATGVLIQCETRPAGYLGGLVALRDGRLAFGYNPVLSSPLILASPEAITAAGNVIARWVNDSVFEQHHNAAGVQQGYRYWMAGSSFGEVANTNVPRRTTIDGVVAMEVTRTTLGPGVDNAVSGGAPSKRYTQIYAAAGSINTSDERLKQWRGALTDAELAAAREIGAVIGVYQWLDAIATKGDAARWHIGVKAQEVATIFQKHGLDPTQYGLYCHDIWEAEEAVYAPGERITISEGKAAAYSMPETPGEEPVLLQPAVDPVYEYGEPTLIKPAREAGEMYGIRPDELLFFLVAAQEQRITALEAALTSPTV